MSNVALFTDISNLYYCIGKRFSNRKLNYQALLDTASSFGTLTRSVAYGTQVDDEASGFIRCLQRLGFDAKYKRPKMQDVGDERRIVRKADWKVGIAIDVVRTSQKVDTVILASTDTDMAELLIWLRDQGVRVIIIGCGISRELKELADRYVEISENMLEAPREEEAQAA